MPPVHTLLVLSSLITVTGGSFLLLHLLRRTHDWSWHRRIQLLVLLLPMMIFLLGLGLLHYMLVRLCAHVIPSWEVILDYTLPFCMTFVGVSAFSLGGIRLLLLRRFIKQQRITASTDVQRIADEVADKLSVKSCRVLLCLHPSPLALTYGLFRSTILLSPWMLENLDRSELEAVLAHELQHVAHRDSLVIFLATCLRDTFFYLPTSRKAYRLLQQEKELLCDDLAVQGTQRPLSLASALTKVWLHALNTPYYPQGAGVQSLLDGNAMMKRRIARLLEREDVSTRHSSQVFPFGSGVLMLMGFVIFQGLNLALSLQIAGCNPLVLLAKFL